MIFFKQFLITLAFIVINAVLVKLAETEDQLLLQAICKVILTECAGFQNGVKADITKAESKGLFKNTYDVCCCSVLQNCAQLECVPPNEMLYIEVLKDFIKDENYVSKPVEYFCKVKINDEDENKNFLQRMFTINEIKTKLR